VPTYAVEYVYADRPSDLDATRPTHRAFLRSLLDAGDLIASGPLGAGGGALLIVRADDAAGACALLDEDPFRLGGLVAQRIVREWEPLLRSWE
jgi:uncharacterized protein YciI